MPFQGLGGQHEKGYFSTRIGPLQRQLRKGEYELFKGSPMFESNFIQISKQGGPIEIHNQEQIVTIGITTSNRFLLIPDVLLLARPTYLSKKPTRLHNNMFHRDCKVKYELSRLFPLRLVKISIHNAEKQQLKFKLASGRTFYLQLCPESYKQKELFDTWTRMIQLLWPPSETKFERKEFDRIWSSPSPRPTAPSPKPTIVSMTAWSDLSFTKNLKKDKEKRKNSKAKSPIEEPAPPLQAWEVTDTSEEDLIERSPFHGRQAVEKEGHERSPTSRRRPTKESHSSRNRSRQRGATRKPSKLLSLIRSCSWGEPRHKRHIIQSRSKEKERSTR